MNRDGTLLLVYTLRTTQSLPLIVIVDDADFAPHPE